MVSSGIPIISGGNDAMAWDAHLNLDTPLEAAHELRQRRGVEPMFLLQHAV